MEGKKKWGLLVCGTVMLLFLGLIYAWSIFRAPFNEIYTAWTPTQLSMTFTISIICFCLGGFISGKIISVLKPKIVILISAALLFVGFFVVSGMNPRDESGSLAALYVFYGVFGGCGVGITYNAVLSSVTKWFPGKTGLASGILLFGFGLGGMILGTVVNGLIADAGIFTTFFYLAVIIAIVLVIGAFVIKMPPAAKGSSDGREVKNYTLGEMLKTPSFWVFFIWELIICSAGLLVINSAANIAVAFGAAATLGLIVSVFNGGGRIVIGTLFDKKGRKISMTANTVIMVLAGIFLFTGALTGNMIFIFIGLPLVGISYGGTPSLTSAITNKFYGPKHYPVNLSIVNFALIPAALIGPLISSMLQESSGGAYNTTFIMLIVLAAVALLFNGLTTAFAKKENLD